MLRAGDMRGRMEALERDVTALREALAEERKGREEEGGRLSTAAQRHEEQATALVAALSELTDRYGDRYAAVEAQLAQTRDDAARFGDMLNAIASQAAQAAERARAEAGRIDALAIAIDRLTRRVDVDAEEAVKTVIALLDRMARNGTPLGFDISFPRR